MGHHPVEQSQVARLGGGDHARAPHQLQRLGRADETGQEERPAPIGHQPEFVEHLPDGRLLRGDAVVAGERQVGAAARRGAVHDGEHGLRRGSQGERHVLPGGDQSRPLAPQHSQVGPGAEGPARARDRDDAHALAAAQETQRLE